MIQNSVRIIITFILLWYCGAMFNFFPFIGDNLAINAIGFTGLLHCAVLVVCTCWIIHELKKK